jgi:hypothetical protein
MLLQQLLLPQNPRCRDNDVIGIRMIGVHAISALLQKAWLALRDCLPVWQGIQW